jgi:hypothetical protein
MRRSSVHLTPAALMAGSRNASYSGTSRMMAPVLNSAMVAAGMCRHTASLLLPLLPQLPRLPRPPSQAGSGMLLSMSDPCWMKKVPIME